MPEKPCQRCGETKPLEEFNRDRTKRDGRMSVCRACRFAANHDGKVAITVSTDGKPRYDMRIKVSDDEIVALYERGVSVADIPAGGGRIRRVLRLRGVARDRVAEAKAEIAQRNANIEGLVASGTSVEDVARIYRLSPRYVRDLTATQRQSEDGLTEAERRVADFFRGPVLADPARATTKLRERMIERANARKVEAWQR